MGFAQYFDDKVDTKAYRIIGMHMHLMHSSYIIVKLVEVGHTFHSKTCDKIR